VGQERLGPSYDDDDFIISLVLGPLLMVRTFLKVYVELGSYFLFLQEQINDLIIIGVSGCVFITAVPIIKLCAWGEGDSGGHVLQETTSRGLWTSLPIRVIWGRTASLRLAVAGDVRSIYQLHLQVRLAACSIRSSGRVQVPVPV
jgi:hypothetical protein